jgi:rare lipoprotein A
MPHEDAHIPAISRSVTLLACGLAAVLSAAACSPSVSRDGDTAAQVSREAPAQTREESAADAPRKGQTQTGVASYMADRLHGRTTASGEPYDRKALVAAHPTYPMGTVLRVTNLENGRVVTVKVIDRSARDANRRIIDLSRAAAEQLDFIQSGLVKVTTEVIERPPQRSK